MGNKNPDELLEFDASSGVDKTADPYGAGDTSRSADKSGGESSYSSSTKSEVLSAIMKHIGGLDKNALVDIYKAYGPQGSTSRAADKSGGEGSQVSTSSTAVDPVTGGASVNTGSAAAATKSSKTGKGEEGQVSTSPTTVKASYKEDVEEIFANDELSEEIKHKASVVFEAAVNARLVLETARLEEEFETRLEEAVEEIRSEVVDNVDKYLSYAVEEWMEENQVAIDSGLKVEMAEDLLSNLKSIFESNYIDIPETKVDVVAEMSETIEDLEAQLNEQIEKNVELKEKYASLEVQQVFSEMSENLAETQVEKLRALSEGISYDSTQEYKNKLSVIRETYFPSTSKQPVDNNVLTEETHVDDESDYVAPMNGRMAAYVNTAKKLSKATN